MPGVRVRISVPYSLRCPAAEFWNNNIKKCARCETRFWMEAGHEFSVNCGLSDDGGQHESELIVCRQGTFNDGTFVRCRPCSTCQASELASVCTTTSDSRCCGEGQHVENGECKDSSQTTTARSAAVTTEQPTPTMTTSRTTAFKNVTNSAKTTQTLPTKTTPTFPIKTTQTLPSKANQMPTSTAGINHDQSWIAPVAVTFIILLCAGLMYILKKRNCREIKRRLSNKRNHIHLEGSNERLKTESTKDLLDINNLLPQEIQAAPLQSVLNNLDVVDELVLLLDPDTPGAKNTRHLAANCSIPFTWINYAYSMKESKSPLVAMLEKVIAKNPNWNVGHLASLLSSIERNDAVAVLAKINLTEEEV